MITQNIVFPCLDPTDSKNCAEVDLEDNCRMQGCAWDRKLKICVNQCEIHANTFAIGEQINEGDYDLSDADCEKLCLDDYACMAFVNMGECMKFSTMYSYVGGYDGATTGKI